MSWIGWVVIGIIAVIIGWEFWMICPDKLPWRKRK
jgi:hypothetical protein